jgi:iron(III) transport system ATP-binding protein
VRLAGIEGAIRVPHTARAVGPVSVSIRPEKVEIVRSAEAPAGTPDVVSAKIESSSYHGNHFRYGIRIGDVPLAVTTTRRVDAVALTVRLPPEEIRIYYPESPEK